MRLSESIQSKEERFLLERERVVFDSLNEIRRQSPKRDAEIKQ